jgi:hypothetical protein
MSLPLSWATVSAGTRSSLPARCRAPPSGPIGTMMLAGGARPLVLVRGRHVAERENPVLPGHEQLRRHLDEAVPAARGGQAAGRR